MCVNTTETTEIERVGQITFTVHNKYLLLRANLIYNNIFV